MGGLGRVTLKSAGGLSGVTLKKCVRLESGHMKKRGRFELGHTEKAREAWVGSHREARVNFLYHLLCTLSVTTDPLTVLLENHVIPQKSSKPPFFPPPSPSPLGEK